mmetsp:Transcript_59191/g.139570  ORF Transcript_59191/g.139570 Transcript_59191/m.139570 type:complete len:286 (-) Transcript_59191:75-932(-)
MTCCQLQDDAMHGLQDINTILCDSHEMPTQLRLMEVVESDTLVTELNKRGLGLKFTPVPRSLMSLVAALADQQAFLHGTTSPMEEFCDKLEHYALQQTATETHEGVLKCVCRESDPSLAETMTREHKVHDLFRRLRHEDKLSEKEVLEVLDYVHGFFSPHPIVLITADPESRSIAELWFPPSMFIPEHVAHQDLPVRIACLQHVAGGGRAFFSVLPSQRIDDVSVEATSVEATPASMAMTPVLQDPEVSESRCKGTAPGEGTPIPAIVTLPGASARNAPRRRFSA